MAEELIKRVDRALEGLLTKAECRSIQHHSEKSQSAISVVVPMLVVAELNGAMFLLALLAGRPYVLAAVLVAVVALNVVGVRLVYRWRDRKVFQRMMATLRDRGVRPHFCLHCEYDLRGSLSEHCPECGSPLAPPMSDVPEDYADTAKYHVHVAEHDPASPPESEPTNWRFHGMTMSLYDRLNEGLEGMLTDALREDLHEHCGPHRGRTFKRVVIIGGFAMGGVLLLAVWPFFSEGVFIVLCYAVFIGLLIVACQFVRMYGGLLGKRLMARLDEVGVRPHVCVNCGADLRGTTFSHCRDCGVPLAPVVLDEDSALSPRL